MSYRVLARTCRSNTFEEVVGQEPIATTLRNALRSGRVHHGYLFTGTRGVGKTSMARILAKALNCLAADAPTTTPCCSCAVCKAIAIGEDVDVVEIDAASNTGVDNIRELRSNATLRPARSRFKVYIIDEVHMLSAGAFNALLKTLEEPPSHVKFILATTEAHKVPLTIQSRCQRFDFRAIGAEAIAEHLRRILHTQNVVAEDAVVRRIARLANGSMRDALSLLDMLFSYEGRNLTTELVSDIIPPAHDEMAATLLDHVVKQDAAGALRALDAALQGGRTIERFSDHLIEHVRTLMLLGVCGEDTELVDVPPTVRPSLAAQSAHFDAATYVYMIALLEELRRNVKFSGAARALADAAVVRLTMSRRFTDIDELLRRLGPNEGPPPTAADDPAPKKKEKHRPPNAAPRSEEDTYRGGQPSPPDGGRRSAPPDLAPSSHGVNSAQWWRASSDPFVLRVKEAVEGTLRDVRKPGVPKTLDAPPNGDVDALNAEQWGRQP